MKITPRRLLKTIFLILFLSFTKFFYINQPSTNIEHELFNEKENHVKYGKSNEKWRTRWMEILLTEQPNANNNFSHQQNLLLTNFSVQYHEDKNKTKTSFNLDEYSPLGKDLEAIQEYIKQANKDQHIRNLDRYDLSTHLDTVVIVVQVHDRAHYIRYLIESLQAAEGIEQVLLIFSHDVFDDHINQLIHDITFCPVMQIFYPLSIQLFPNQFPGNDPRDCPRNANMEEVVKLRCKNLHWPDKYGHYRQGSTSQTKHHWFWKINHVFDYLNVTKYFNGPILFIEEDHYVAPDFLFVLEKMYRLDKTAREGCSIFTLGAILKRFNFDVAHNVDILTWSAQYNMGMAMTRSVWDKINACTHVFCTYDDYNWDWSLQHVSHTCLQKKLQCMVMKLPRIFHIGACGVHHKRKNCEATVALKPVKDVIRQSAPSLFPDVLVVHSRPRKRDKPFKPFGGWGDFRDKQLCMDFTTPKYH